jgi:sugar phosphate isomerase/epimerase
MWARNNFSNLEDFFKKAHQLGFPKIELNHQITSAMLAGINLRQYQFRSIHEPCPADLSPEVLKQRDWLVSSPDEDNRRQGVKAIQRSINLAFELGAPVIVMHAGLVHTDITPEKKLRTLFDAGKCQTDEFLTLQNEMIQYRAKCSEEHLDLENRYHYFDIPLLDEMGILLELADSERLGFIYDVGHAQALDRLGFYPHEEWLKRYALRMIGAHLHDVNGVDDHFAPGLGEIDFDHLADYLPENAFRTCELQPAMTAEQVSDGLKILAEHGCIRSLKN